MRRLFPVLTILALWVPAVNAAGILIPDDVSVQPLAMVNHKVTIGIDDQVATTKVEQTFRNNTDRPLEATYIFPAPAGASVKKFSMWVDGKEVSGELVEAAKAKSIYTDVIRRSQNPGLLEYMNRNLFKVRVAAIPAKSDQKVSLTYSSIADRAGDAIEYTYPLKTDGKTTATLEEYSIGGTIKSQHIIHNVYSPTHALNIKRNGDKEVAFSFDRNQGTLDKDFQLFYSHGDKDIGLTALAHRPIKDESGYFLMLLAPKVELPKDFQVPRDVVLVLDTSGSMKGVKLEQAKKALKFCLGQLTSADRFAMIDFSSKIVKYRPELTEAKGGELDEAKKWVDNLKATGGTNINEALLDSFDFRAKDPTRTFTILFFTDGMPSVSERNPEQILKNVMAKNDGNTRIFSVGVGNDVNASFLDRIAEQTRGESVYVRPEEDVETKTAALYSKISHPVLANLKLTVTPDVQLEEVYPPHLPDLYKGGQIVVLGRYAGKGTASVKLTGVCGKDAKEYTYSFDFADKTAADRDFVEHLWARRKVGYLLDQIRVNGEKKELVDEVTTLAKKYGITTPYTSYLIVTDGPVAKRGEGAGFGGGGKPMALAPAAPGAEQRKVSDLVKQQTAAGELGQTRGNFESDKLKNAPTDGLSKDEQKALQDAKEKKDANDRAREALARRDQNSVQNGKLGVDLSVQSNQYRNQTRMEQTAVRKVGSRNCLEIGGVWIDEGVTDKTPTLVVKAMSDAYFRILERHPQVKDVFRLGNHLVWLTPSGTALVIDTTDGKDKLADAEIDKLFVAKK